MTIAGHYDLEPRFREICRYLGIKGSLPDREVTERISKCTEILQKAADPRAVFQRFPIRRTDALEIAGMEIRSRNLFRNLSGCSEAYLFSATLGIEVDRIIRRAEIVNMSTALFYQAVGAELIEVYADLINEKLRQEAAENGEYLRPRFSPGYGDFPLSFQPDFCRILQLRKELGITLTDTLLMVPSKSITAVIGIAGYAPDHPEYYYLEEEYNAAETE